MYKKNYLSPREQELWEYLGEKEIITPELVREIFPDLSLGNLNKVLSSLFKKKYLNRARRDLYYNPLKLKNIHELAFRIREGYLGLNSALKYYHLLEYEDFTIFMLTKNYRKKILLKGTAYTIEFLPMGKYFCGFEKKENIFVSSIEKTLFDCLLKPRLVNLSDLTKAIYESKLDWEKLKFFFTLTENASLCQRTGYLLELLKKEMRLKVPKAFLDFLWSRVGMPVKLTSGKGKSRYVAKWKVQDNLGKEKILGWWY